MSEPVEILKVLPEHRCIVGWASVAGVVDGEGDVIDITDLHDAVLDMQKSGNRTAKLNHAGDGPIGEIVGSLVLDKATSAALGLSVRDQREGWIVQIFIEDESTWQAVRRGELAMLSIGGSAERITDA